MAEVHKIPESADDITDESWLQRFDAKINELSDYVGSYSEKTGKDDALAWRDLGHRNTPEDAALEEMENWDPPEVDSEGERLEALSRIYHAGALLHGYNSDKRGS